ncbi:AbrB family transcriptional regulator [Shinella sp. CPCC 100929]|uniref:AbrB family transcriptional regulator n=1 Tax=Shinella lacus TaxID=2654216 RepID=A0ABT1R1G3_9HYPH|nr:AbrB family transcriptional regulator [Shinella lacus]MCQ4629017.1 AbrB family transcriptional regulator [Shinella lacus]
MKRTAYLARLALSLAIGACGGTAFYLLSLPLPWMLGAMSTVLVAALLRLPVVSARRIRPPMAAVIGVMLGSSFSPDMLGRLDDWVPVTLAAVAATVLTGAAGYLYLRHVAKLDPVTAYFAGMPAGVYEMTAQGGLAGGDERRIALVQATRVFLVVFTVPMVLNLFLHFGSTGGLSLQNGHGALSLADIAILVVCGAVGWPLAKALHLPNPPLIGPMLVSAVAHAVGLTEGAPPYLLVSMAQVVLGTTIGGQFLGSDRGLLFGSALHSLVLVPVMVAIAALAAWGVARWSGGGYPATFLALAPGGTTEMSLVALAIKAEVALVVFHQIVRQICIHMFAPAVFRSIQRP